jgi:hypothetical protein
MGWAYSGNAGGPIRSEIPIPIAISAGDAVESDSTETDNIKTPNTNLNTSLRTERFIVIAFPLASQFWPLAGKSASLRFAHINPERLRLLRRHGIYFESAG